MIDIDTLKEQLIQINKPLRKSNYPTIYNQVVVKTAFLPQTSKIKERIYCIQHDITSLSSCKHCGINPVKFLGPSFGYRDFCSTKCSSNSTSKQESIKLTNLLKFGTKTPAESDSIKQKTTQTLESKYGAGIKSTQQVPSIRNKTITTNLNKFGSESYTGSEVGKHVINNSHLENYGKIRFTQTPMFKIKFTATCVKKYDRECHQHTHIELDNITKLNDAFWLNDQHTNQQKPQSQIALELGVGATTISRKFHKFNIESLSFFQSGGESDLNQFISNNYTGEIQTRTKKIIHPYELDIYLPDLNIAIEYNGIYWHSENNKKDKNYHLNKYKLCRDKGIRLIQIYDTEWQQTQDVVKSKLLYLLNKDTKILADNCTVKLLTQQQKSQFLTQNNLQGDYDCIINIGLYYNEELVFVAGFDDVSGEGEYELKCVSPLLNHTVCGGCGKLLQFFIQEYYPKSIIFYNDLRWNDKIYAELNMKYDKNISPDYQYFKPNVKILMSKQQFQLNNLTNILGVFDPKLTEWENMKNNGYYRIWDCGYDKFSLTLC
jgi:very-short-patch-repair endonuclease